MTLDPLTSREQAEHEESQQMDDWAEAQHTALLESYVKQLWESTLRFSDRDTGEVGKRLLVHRLEILARNMHTVTRYGVRNGYEADYKLDLLLTEWGCGKLIAYFGALAETEGKL
jgi:hypothetical protein